MKSAKLGAPTLVEVSNVSTTGLWLLIGDKERFLPFADFPWFREARIRELVNVELQSPDHLYWPDLDIDLAVQSIDHPERFPLVSRARSNTAMNPSPQRSLAPAAVPSARKRREPRRGLSPEPLARHAIEERRESGARPKVHFKATIRHGCEC